MKKVGPIIFKCREDANLEIKMEIFGWRFSKDMLSGWSCFPIRKRQKIVVGGTVDYNLGNLEREK